MIPKRLIYKNNKILFLDQRLLPEKIKYITAKTPLDGYKAIKNMVLRGAPLIGCSAAYSYILSFDKLKFQNKDELKKKLDIRANLIKSARPTAVSLFKAIDRMHKKAIQVIDNIKSDKKIEILKRLTKELKEEADKITNEDISSTIKMAKIGQKLLKKNSKVITYCNTGELATMGIGTALGVITQGFKKGKIKFVYACETRPYLQGARLTIWELKRNSIPSALITDNMAAHIMKTEKIDAIIIGADRIALNGDTANKIGSYSLAIAAKFHKIPFYVVAPTDTIDYSINTGKDIKIEERSAEEVIKVKGKYIAPKDIKVRHPAFDVTPASLITAIITEKGIIKPVNKKNILINIKSY